MNKLKNKIAIITGGANGIGAEVAKTFAKNGAYVIITDKNKIEAKKTVNEINKFGKSIFFIMDVSIELNWKSFVKFLNKNNINNVDVLVNNAGVYFGKDILKVTANEFQKLISINLLGTFFGIKFITPFLKKAGLKTKFGSSVINLSSIAGLVGSRLDPLYSMSKGGITTFTKSMAIYFGNKKLPIRINQIHPGIIETDMGLKVQESRIKQNPGLSIKQSYKEGINQTPLGRLGKAKEIADGILFLASDDSSFMTGSSLVVDGGLTAQ